MQKEINIQVSPEVAATSQLLLQKVSTNISIPKKDINHVQILKRSVDARQKNIKINLRLRIFIGEAFQEQEITLPNYKDVSNAREVIIVGAGPAGLFAALRLIEGGLKPIVLERGKDVKARRRDLVSIIREAEVNPDSNYCFGEGGAGTYSDGKLYTRSKKKGDVRKILNLFVGFGATDQILVEAHPHIGTNKLPSIISAMREKIIEHGGEVHFNTKVIDFKIKNNAFEGVKTKNGTSFNAKNMILATGHSARDIFELLYFKGIEIEAKPFALGVRVEHTQRLIDKIQYKCEDRGAFLPAAPYAIVKQVEGRGVYSFCMCPGGVIAPCATNPGEVVTNGWSPSRRDRDTSNSGIVVELTLKDFAPYAKFGPLAGVALQKSIEQKAWHLAGETQKVPAQRLIDFVEGKQSKDIPETSYKAGTTSIEMGKLLPSFIHESLKAGFKSFGESMKGYLTNEAVIHAPESRTSSPVRIPRDKQTLEHPQVKGFYPCGEGAGYAGGIISAAIDGEKCAERILGI
ncbi:MAG: NAD(P)/FAD-dependent oxidoreductase [Chitinophagales bacterium]